MRHAIETAPRDGNVVILEDDASGTCDVAHWAAEAGEWVGENGEPSKITPSHWYPMPGDKYLPQEDDGSSTASQVGPSAPRARWLFVASSITATLIAAALIGLYFEQEPRFPSQDSRQTNLPALQQQAEADQASPQARAQEAAQVKQAAEASGPEARQSLEMEQRAEALAHELAEARRAIDGLNLQLLAEAAKTAQLLGQEREKTAVLVQEATAARQELTGTAQHRHAIEEERARGAALASELALARREIETNVALLNKARDDAAQFKQTTERTTAELQQERDRAEAEAAKFAQLLGEERQDATAVREELTASTAQHRRALEEERARGAALASELTTARTETETLAALLRKASDETGQLKQAEAAKSTQSLEQEHEKTVALVQEATAARQELAASTAQHRRALDEERARRAALWSELAMAQREIETHAAQLRKARDETRQLEQTTERMTAELQQERDRAEAGAVKSAQLLGEERARGAALASELALARRETETNVALLNKARDDAAQFNQTAERTTAGLQQERDRAEALSRELTMARESAQRAINAGTTLERTANSQITQMTQAAEAAATGQPAAAEAQGGPEATRLLARASALLGQGNIGAARMVLERAAETGSAQASFMLAETYDPVILSTWGTYGTRGEATKARELYAKAHGGGIQEAKNRFDRLDQ